MKKTAEPTARKLMQFKADAPGTVEGLRSKLLQVEIALRLAHREAREKLADAHQGGACPLIEAELMVELTTRPLLALGYNPREARELA